MNCREFLIEFEERRGDLTEAATLHLKICVECQKTSREQTGVWLMIDNLRSVAAPNDFDFRVKARIAKGKPAQNIQPPLLPALRYVLPIGIVVLLFGLVAFNANYFSGGNSAPQTAAVETPPATEIIGNDSSSINSFAGNQVAVANPGSQASAVNSANVSIESNGNIQENQFAAVKFPSKPRIIAPQKNVKDETGGGSRDSAFSSAPITLPIGIQPDRKIETLPNVGNSNAITDKEFLEFIGIKINSDKGVRKVISIGQNTAAERSGVKVGDVIEAINGEKLSAEPLRVKTIEAKTLTVFRGTEKIEITLKN